MRRPDQATLRKAGSIAAWVIVAGTLCAQAAATDAGAHQSGRSHSASGHATVQLAASSIVIAPPEPEQQPPACRVCPPTMKIRAGQTLMGSETGGEAEQPVVPQTIAGFEMAAFEITVAEIRRYESETGKRIPRGCWVWTEDGRMRNRDDAYWGAPGYPVEDASPAACLNWDDAVAYATWLSDNDPSADWGLPSEAQFEYAARAGTTGDYPWEGGVAAICSRVNGADSSSRFRWKNSDCSDGAPVPVAAGRYPVNAFGLGEVVGNLWEWTADCWNQTHAGATSDGSARMSGNCASRVLRGGSWDDPVENLRASYRVGIPKSRRQGNVGFRLVRTEN